MAMRVVAGEARGRRLVAPPGTAVRPTSDRVREATFNALASLGALDGADVLDLFAGSGALAIEALSRGAARALLVESDRRAREAIESNLAATGFVDRARVVAADAFAELRAVGPVHDLALLDPPYAFGDDRWADLLTALVPRLAADALLVAESDRALDAGPRWGILRSKRYSDTVVTIARLQARPPQHPGATE